MIHNSFKVKQKKSWKRQKQDLQEVGDDLSVSFLNLDFVSEKIKTKRKEP